MQSVFKGFLGRRWVRWGGIAVIVFIAGVFLFRKNGQVVYETVEVKRGSVVEQVIVSGQVKPKQFASLRFKTTGSIAKLHADVGDAVSAGETLAALDASELSKKVTQAEADLVSAEVSLANSQQDVADQRIKGDQALAVIYAGMPSSFSDILNWSEQAYATFISFFDSNDRLTASISNPILVSQRVIDANNSVVVARAALAKMRTTIENFSATSDRDDFDAALAAIHQPLYDLQASLNALTNTVASVPTGAIAAATLSEYKTEIATARGNINSAIAEESDLAADVRDAKVQNTLNLNAKLASERSATASLEAAKAALEIAKQNLSEAYLRAPFAGTVAARSKQVGELVTNADQVFYLIGEGGLEVTANIPEVDIAKVAVGNAASVELDAYEDSVLFPVTVSEIDPAETLVDGITTYKATFAFAAADSRVRSGMTANIRVETNRRDNVLVIPQRAVFTKADGKFVRLPPATPDAEPAEVSVRLGLRGSDGMIEVVGGLDERATIVAGIK